MLKWFHHLFNPHCAECRLERAESTICNSCENLKYEVNRLTNENARLLERILERPEVIPERTEAPILTAPLPRANTWQVRKAMLEAEDREKAKLLKNAPISTESLEKDLLDATHSREKESRSN